MFLIFKHSKNIFWRQQSSNLYILLLITKKNMYMNGYNHQMINQFKNFPFTQFMNAPCRTVLKQLLLPAMVTTRALNSALFIIFHTHFCPLQFKVFQGCLKWCIMRLVNLSSHWGEILSKEVFLSLWTQSTSYYSLWHCTVRF